MFFQSNPCKGLWYHYMDLEYDDVVVYVFIPQPEHKILACQWWVSPTEKSTNEKNGVSCI